MGTQSSWQGEQSAHNNGLVDQARGAVSEVAGTAKERVGSQIGNQKGRLSEQINEVAQALRDTGSRLGESEQSSFAASYVDKAAAQVERIANYVESRDVGDIVSEVQNLARREPAAFFGGLFALGLVAGRFLKSSAPQTSPAASARSAGANDRGMTSRTWESDDRTTRSRSWEAGDQRSSAVDQRSSAISQQGRQGEASEQREGGAGSSLGRPQQQAKPDVIPPAPVREVGTEQGVTGASSAPSLGTASDKPGTQAKREPRGGSSGGAS